MRPRPTNRHPPGGLDEPSERVRPKPFFLPIVDFPSRGKPAERLMAFIDERNETAHQFHGLRGRWRRLWRTATAKTPSPWPRPHRIFDPYLLGAVHSSYAQGRNHNRTVPCHARSRHSHPGIGDTESAVTVSETDAVAFVIALTKNASFEPEILGLARLIPINWGHMCEPGAMPGSDALDRRSKSSIVVCWLVKSEPIRESKPSARLESWVDFQIRVRTAPGFLV
jgi:hypothetical protein